MHDTQKYHGTNIQNTKQRQVWKQMNETCLQLHRKWEHAENIECLQTNSDYTYIKIWILNIRTWEKICVVLRTGRLYFNESRFHDKHYLMTRSLPVTSLQEATGSGRVEFCVRSVPMLTCAWLASQLKAPVKVRGTGVPSPGKEVPSPWQLHRAAATCLLGRPHMKREALCNPTGITPPNNAALKERQKPCIKHCWGGARLWSPTTTNTDCSATSHLPKSPPPLLLAFATSVLLLPSHL